MHNTSGDGSFHVETDMGDPKPMGVFGAPACRCTDTVIALVASLVGLTLFGGGVCMVGFFSHDPLLKIGGIALAVCGILLMVGGAFFFIIDHLRKTQQKRRATMGEGTIISPPPQQMPMQTLVSAPQVASTIAGEAPPPYDAVADQPQRTNSRGQTSFPRHHNQPHQVSPVNPQPPNVNLPQQQPRMPVQQPPQQQPRIPTNQQQPRMPIQQPPQQQQQPRMPIQQPPQQQQQPRMPVHQPPQQPRMQVRPMNQTQPRPSAPPPQRPSVIQQQRQPAPHQQRPNVVQQPMVTHPQHNQTSV